MKERILVYMSFRADGVSLRTVSRSKKSPGRFYITNHELEELERKPKIIIQDIYSFAVLRLDRHAGTIRIKFTWLESREDNAAGYRETVILPYPAFMERLQESARENKLVLWHTLSLDDSGKQTKLVFKSKENLHAVVQDKVIRRKFVRFLRDQFQWEQAEKIEIYDDFVPYSFYFREIKNGEPGICGGLILHRQDDMENAYYSMHT